MLSLPLSGFLRGTGDVVKTGNALF
jgi:hypothetical protein